MPEKTKENPTGSPLGKFSILNLVVKGVDALTGYDRTQSKKYFAPKKVFKDLRKILT